MKIFKTGALCAALLFALSGSAAAESTVVKIPQKMDNGETVEVYYRKGQPITANRVRAGEFKTETMILKAERFAAKVQCL